MLPSDTDKYQLGKHKSHSPLKDKASIEQVSPGPAHVAMPMRDQRRMLVLLVEVHLQCLAVLFVDFP
jgi:hypothetical protein